MKAAILPALVLAGLTLCATAVCATPAPPRSGDGQRLYRQYCASCHGVGGRGDGQDAAIFAVRPRDLRTGFLERYPAADLVRRIRDGRPLDLTLDEAALRAHALQVEEVIQFLKRLPSVDKERFNFARDLYFTRCSACHGLYGRPGAVPTGVRRPRDLSDASVQRSVTDRQLMTRLGHGERGMPALVPRLSEADARALLPFVRLLSPGFEIYAQYCASCHGDDGRGPELLAGEFERPTAAFDRAYFAHRDAERLRSSVWHMLRAKRPAMPHYRAVLDETQARAIVVYLQDLR